MSAKGAIDLQDAELVVGVVVKGQPRAYPVQLIFMHEVLNDQIGGEPICVTWCELTLSGVVFSRRAGEDPHRMFSRSAMTHQGNLILIDQRTQSEWSQLGHGAFKGKLDKTPLTIIPSVQTTWRHWHQKHPESEVLDVPFADGPPYQYVGEKASFGVEELDLVIGIDSPTVKAYPFAELEEHPLSDRVGDLDIRIHFEPTAHAAWITDASGNLLPAVTTMRGAWSLFNPESGYYTRVRGEGENPVEKREASDRGE
ncbi:MAG: DUF3179 domain-containing (seleno)protein [Planctomycetota bacterium]|nr:DUF3179 domain-containing (seleno)protein [Planctomycetota bacterium]